MRKKLFIKYRKLLLPSVDNIPYRRRIVEINFVLFFVIWGEL